MNLVDILSTLITSPGRAGHQLAKGLWLVYYPPAADYPHLPDGAVADDDTHRLVIGRQHVEPSPIEERTVRAALQEALDNLDSAVPDLGQTWEAVGRGVWHGAAIAWTLAPAADSFSDDLERAARFRRLSESRQKRLDARRPRKPTQPTPNALFPESK